MRDIIKLLRRAQRLHSANGNMTIATVNYNDALKRFVTDGAVYDSSGVICEKWKDAEFDTLEKAILSVDALAAQNHSSDNLTFIIDYGTMPEGG